MKIFFFMFLLSFAIKPLAAAQISVQDFNANLLNSEFRSSLENAGYEKAKAEVDKHAVTQIGQSRYCTGYLCAHYTVDFCDRASETCKYASSGSHALVMMRQELTLPDGKGKAEYYCIYEPQYGLELDRELCWLRHPQDRALGAWKVPAAVDKKYREKFPSILNAKDPAFEVSHAELYRNRWHRWWENTFASDGQLMSVCEQQNVLLGGSGEGKGPEFDPLPSEMPKCADVFLDKCKNDQAAIACNLTTPKGRNICQPLKCKDKQWTFLSWQGLDAPACGKLSELNHYCKEWKNRFRRWSNRYRSHWDYASESTRHFCRNVSDVQNENYGLRQFSCDTGGSAVTSFGEPDRFAPLRKPETTLADRAPSPHGDGGSHSEDAN